MTENQKRKPSEVSADKHVWSLHAASFLLTVPDGFFFQSEWSVNVYVAVRFFLSLSLPPPTPLTSLSCLAHPGAFTDQADASFVDIFQWLL